MTRPTVDEYLMGIAVAARTRGTCDRRQVGCVVADAKGCVLSMGYNGSLPGAPHCDEAGHYMVDGHCNRTVHAETNAVAHAAARGTALRGAVAYTTTFPCINCFRLLASAGIKRVVYMDDYKDPTHKSDSMMDVVNFAAEAGVPLIKYSGSRPWEDADA